MQHYSYTCLNCEKRFTLTYDSGCELKESKCPGCGSSEVKSDWINNFFRGIFGSGGGG